MYIFLLKVAPFGFLISTFWFRWRHSDFLCNRSEKVVSELENSVSIREKVVSELENSVSIREKVVSILKISVSDPEKVVSPFFQKRSMRIESGRCRFKVAQYFPSAIHFSIGSGTFWIFGVTIFLSLALFEFSVSPFFFRWHNLNFSLFSLRQLRYVTEIFCHMFCTACSAQDSFEVGSTPHVFAQ